MPSVSEDDIAAPFDPRLAFGLDNRKRSPDEAQANQDALMWELLGAMPVIGNMLSASDAIDTGAATANAVKAGDWKQTAIQGGLTALNALGAVSGLPWGKTAGEAAKAGKDSANMFLPPTAKGTDTTKLKQALEMEIEGKSPEYIWRETGFDKDAANNWWWEISDDKMKFKEPNLNRSGPAQFVVDHPELFENMQGTKFLPMNMTTSELNGISDWNPTNNKIRINAPTDPRQRSATAHEFQHSVQGASGRQSGANSTWPPAHNLEQAKYEILPSIYGPNSFKADEAMDMFWATKGTDDEAAKKWLEKYYKLQDTMRPTAKATNVPTNAKGAAYHLDLGEVQARNTQKRLDFTPKERATIRPELTEDVARDYHIFAPPKEPAPPTATYLERLNRLFETLKGAPQK